MLSIIATILVLYHLHSFQFGTNVEPLESHHGPKIQLKGKGQDYLKLTCLTAVL